MRTIARYGCEICNTEYATPASLAKLISQIESEANGILVDVRTAEMADAALKRWT